MKKTILKCTILLITAFIFIDISNNQILSQTEGFIKINNDLKLRYRIIGSGSDTIVVPDAGGQYHYIRQTKSKNTFIVYDVRGRGYSDPVHDQSLIGMDYEISDLERVRQYFNIRRMNLLGSSYFGGLVALYSAKYPNNVISLIMVDPIPLSRGKYWEAFINGFTNSGDPMLDKRVDSLRSAGIINSDPKYFCEEYWKSIIVRHLSNKKLADEIMVSYPCDCENEWPQNMGKGVVGKLGTWDWSNIIRTINVRTLIFHGIDDNIPIESSQEWATLIENSRVLLFHSSGHLPMMEESGLFFEALEQFINGKWPKNSTEIQK